MDIEDKTYLTLTVNDLIGELKEIDQKLQNMQSLVERREQVIQSIQLLKIMLKEREGVDHVLKQTQPYKNADLLHAVYNYLSLTNEYTRTVDIVNALIIGGFDFGDKEPYHQVYDKLTDSLNMLDKPFVKEGSQWGLEEWSHREKTDMGAGNLDDDFL